LEPFVFQEQLVMAGSPQPRPQIVQPDDPSIRLIPLTQGQVAIVDADLYEWAMQWNWCAFFNRSTRSFYAVRTGRHGEPKTVWLHRQFAGEPQGEVDHINGHTLDCRMQNLRPCTHAQNNANHGPARNNTSGYPGVSRHGNGRWRAKIHPDRKQIHLGYFATKDEAIAARKAGELEYFGEFAYSARPANQPPKKPPVSNSAAYPLSMFNF
jgi:hypothetical protein